MKIFIANHPTEQDQVVIIKQGVAGYFPAAWVKPDQVDELNEKAGNTPAEVETAITCSMFDVWANFDSILARAAGQGRLEL